MTKPKQEFMRKQVMNSVHDVSATQPFQVLLTNFSAQPRRLPKGMVVAYGSRSPVALVHLNGLAAQEDLDGHGPGSSFEELQEKDVVHGLTKVDTSEVMHIIKLVKEQLANLGKPLQHEDQILAITRKT